MTIWTTESPTTPDNETAHAVVRVEQTVWAQMELPGWTWSLRKAWATGRWGLVAVLGLFWTLFLLLDLRMRLLPTIPLVAVAAVLWAQRYSGRNAPGREHARLLALETLEAFRMQRQRAQQLLGPGAIEQTDGQREDKWLEILEYKNPAQAQNAAFRVRRQVLVFTQVLDGISVAREQTAQTHAETPASSIKANEQHPEDRRHSGADGQIDPVTAARAGR